jgi:hypothetical protein
MTDIDSSHREILTQFGVYEMTNNPAGIGNECTHWIYAALFEARALDQDKPFKKGDGHFNISQSGIPYTWGRPITADAAQPGDIAQFRNFKNTFFVYQTDGSGGWTTLSTSKFRGPDHTGMVFRPPRSGVYFQLESHIHQKGQALMRVRGNTIYYESFAIALSADDLKQLKGSQSWPSDVDTSDLDDMIERVDWVGMRDKPSVVATRDRLSISMHAADMLTARIKQNDHLAPHKRPLLPIEVNNTAVAFLFIVHTTGDLRFFCPQQSSERLAMDDGQLEDDKADLIHMMKIGGRPGGKPNEDDYGGDNKKVRLHDHRFGWSFPQPSSPGGP